MDYICTNFGVVISNRFPFRVQTHRHTVTDTTDHPNHNSITGVFIRAKNSGGAGIVTCLG